MEDNKKFELSDDALDEVAGGVHSEEGYSVTYNGMTWSVGQLVSVPYCSANVFDCRSCGIADAVIIGLASPNRIIGYENTTVYLRMECCHGETHQPIRNLMPYRPATYN